MRRLQQLLNEKMGADLEADGIYGPMTQASVMAYQAENDDADGKPLDVDGIVGSKTAKAMGLDLDC